MEIFVNVKNVYGNTLYYPACEKSKIFAEIAGSKTLTLDTIEQIEKLGTLVLAETPQI
jgi:hypothetical protein